MEYEVVRQLKAIEKNTESDNINALTVKELCNKFNQDLMIDYFSKCDNPKVVECINEAL